ncbi:glycosyl hydrolase family 2 [Scopulibacillus darangshiensis]|uniref:Glycosyl hydrolase family 2 n=1 Tax=Scopulibacillus darangshiensis TaxID=442528 RepID=A0A4R2NIM3_9BACL|nr:sugar-binding domain-containing protein [Scopulibacillus darangshiensis]TCP21333.1 glycosyl hydrolase family 2 [Scopulibacillus darangshiensis]
MNKCHPRPQFIRNDWVLLDGEWQFAFDDRNSGEMNEWAKGIPKEQTIQVPFSYETKMSGIEDPTHHSVVWYERTINVTHDKNVLLHFEGADYDTTLWVNGLKVGDHQGAYTAFVFDITGYVHKGENQIVVKVEDSVDCSKPRGKQRWLKDNFGCWYVQTTGIWKTVWLEYVSPIHIDNVKMTPEFDNREIAVELHTNKSQSDTSLTASAKIFFEGKIINKVMVNVIDGLAKFSPSVVESGDPWSMKSWSPAHPNLYDITFELFQDGQSIDVVNSYFGMRKISIEGRKILLNNQELYQRLILDQGYWEESDLTPPTVEALETDIDKVLEMGYNGVRKHQKVEDNRFLYLCDKKGLLVWSEVGATYSFNDRAVSNFTNEWLEIVKQNYNHPCIITWVPFNESWGIGDVFVNGAQQKFTEAIYYLTKTFDAMRPVVTNDGWQHTISDIITLHDYEEFGEKLKKRYENSDVLLSNSIQHNKHHYPFAKGYGYQGQPVIISEFGGIAFASESGWGYGNQVKDEEAFINRFDSIHQAIQDLDYVCGFCYTQVTDVQQEINGLLTIGREAKVDLTKIREINERRMK